MHRIGLPGLRRPPRLVTLLLGLWVLNGLDLAFTVVESGRSYAFVELNPVARPLTAASTPMLVAYKVSLLGVGSHILMWLRRHRIAERAAWLLVGAYSCLLAYWGIYFMLIHPAFSDPTRAGM